METDLPDWRAVIVVGSPKEMRRALDAGWDRRNILSPRVRMLEGRKWKHMLITWAALENLTEGDHEEKYAILCRLESDQIRGHAKIEIGQVCPREDIIERLDKEEVETLREIAEGFKIEP